MAYADNLTIVSTNDGENGLADKVNRALDIVDKWLARRNLESVSHKTEVLVLWRMKKPKNINFNIRGTATGTEIKYQGFIIDKNITFSRHVEESCRKAEKAAV